MLAHELRNPLATINAAAELLESYSLRRKRQADNRDVKTPGRTSVSVGRRSAGCNTHHPHSSIPQQRNNKDKCYSYRYY
ncbi:MAG: histidine kinase dimerization/phospho-acceptor domain-containing protein [Limnochordia bacterium]